VVTIAAMGHEMQDRVSLEIARRIAAELPRRPEWLALAGENIEHWRQLNSASASLLKCYDEWSALLSRPVTEVCTALVEPGDRGQRLRQNSPFAGALTPAEVWDIKRRVRHEQNAA
jgi:hypothetical protein